MNRKVNGHPAWKVCIGSTNGTSLWQVGDSSGKNEFDKMAMTTEKVKPIQFKIHAGLGHNFQRKDGIPQIIARRPNRLA